MDTPTPYEPDTLDEPLFELQQAITASLTRSKPKPPPQRWLVRFGNNREMRRAWAAGERRKATKARIAQRRQVARLERGRNQLRALGIPLACYE